MKIPLDILSNHYSELKPRKKIKPFQVSYIPTWHISSIHEYHEYLLVSQTISQTMKVLQIALLFTSFTFGMMIPILQIKGSEELENLLNQLLTTAEKPLVPQKHFNIALARIPIQLKKVAEQQNPGLTAQVGLQKWTRKWTADQIQRKKNEVLKNNYDYILRF